MRVAASLLLLALPVAVGAEPIRPGLYDVRVHIALPHIDTSDYDFTKQLCWRGSAAEPVALGPMGRGPVGACPRQTEIQGAEQIVKVACPGPNAGFAMATYRATAQGFRGRVQINLGGKNMTLAEEQRGTYRGPCP